MAVRGRLARPSVHSTQVVHGRRAVRAAKHREDSKWPRHSEKSQVRVCVCVRVRVCERMGWG